MIGKLKIRRMKSILILSMTLMTVALVGCASHEAAVTGSNESRQIVDMIIDENPDSLILSIRGNQKLTHTEDRQVDPKKIVLFFPATGLDSVKGRFVPPDNDIISSIITNERVENETTNSTIYITLKSDTPYDIIPNTDGLQVTFPTNPALQGKIKPQKKPVENKPQPRPTQKSVPTATVLRTVTTKILENTVAVNVKADGTIKEYKAFSLGNPDRIVFDLYNIKSPYHKEQKIVIQSKWIKRIRYFGHSHKLRLVIDTLNHSVSKYSSVSTDTGLIIHVGSEN